MIDEGFDIKSILKDSHTKKTTPDGLKWFLFPSGSYP